ncbi:PREDICTED: uncharacterized protein LOC105459460 [Wasmannia auropunctata]|uniref:uncharacterized protein LOC105459460 n=1 Tax=Wasmannia auropunctata TaxID=64793 RepID=UPI0005EF13BE|nr:PREDICTED: uncharacterized protein LOC105459460 [Wasmannia auropunctata]
MPTCRAIISRSLVGYFLAGCIVSLSMQSLAQVEGRKCVCTSKACKEAGVDTCRTRFFCYTELIVTAGQEIGESATTRGCTEGATPLLCETKSWVTRSRSVNAMELSASPRVLVPWPRLKCCNSHDYCNAYDDNDDDDDGDGDNNDDNVDDNDNDDNDENASTWTRERKVQMNQTHSTMDREMLMDELTSTNRNTILTLQSDRKYDDPTKSADQLLRSRIRALHIAALVLAVAALISVLASCYVVTRFLRSDRYIMGTVNYS